MKFLGFNSEGEWSSRQKFLLGLVVVVLAVLARLVLGRVTVGNFDTDSGRMVAQIVDQGKSVYANTTRYNYGPWWSWILWLLWQPAKHLAFPNAFHFCITAFLTMVDVAIAWVLAKRFSARTAFFFLLNPVSILITGIHGQFDNLAILVGLLAWMIITPANAKPSLSRFLAAALLVGFSISIKHILAFFPLWVLFCPSFGSLRRRVTFPLVAYAVFVLGFLPWIGDPASLHGIIHNVFLYKSDAQAGIMPILVNLLIPVDHIRDSLPAPWNQLAGMSTMLAWVLSILWLGWWTGQRRPNDLFFVYLVGLVGLSSAMADQYLAIPLVACAVFYRRWPVWLYTIMATLTLAFSNNNLGGRIAFHLHWTVFDSKIPMYPQAQLWLIVLLVVLFFRPRAETRPVGVSPPDSAEPDGNRAVGQTGP
jgi:hypothetical protein